MTVRQTPKPEELLRHAGWMKAMALGLVGDSARADDVVQGAFTAAIESPPRSQSALGGWLRSVVRNLSRQTHRQEARRRKRESAVARPEAQSPSAEELLARTELQRVIVDAVLSLDEPYRSTVILRFFEDRTPHEIAKRDRVPVKTVWTRLSRALDQLRNRLDNSQGGRAEWRALLIPLIAAPVLTAGSAAAATTTAQHTAGTAASSASATSTTTAGSAVTTQALLTATGGTLIMSKTIMGVALIGIGAVGLIMGRYTAPSTPTAASQDVAQVDATAYGELTAERDKLGSELGVKQAKIDELLQQRAELVAENESLRKELAAATTVPQEPDGARPIPVAFGKYAELEGVKNANWHEMAEAAEIMLDLFVELIARDAAGEDPPAGFAQTITKENAKLIKYIGGVATELPTQAAVNGEYTHPVTLTNLLGAMLERADLELDDTQLPRVIAHGEAFEAEYDRLQEGYDEFTLQQQRVLDEVQLKHHTMTQVTNEMTDAQRDVVIADELHGLQQVDVTSPVLMLMMTVNAYPQDSPEELRGSLSTVISQGYNIPVEKLAGLAPAFDQYMVAVESILTPVSAEEAQHYHLEEAIVAGQAYAEMMNAVIAHPGIDSAAQARIRDNPGWFVPRIRQQAVSDDAGN
ncbi:MAG: RNA polymerase sigma factor [Planctomycetota bacterium]